MSEGDNAASVNRRKFLQAAGLAGAGVAAAPLSARAAEPDKAITEKQEWNRSLGAGVDKSPYGAPSRYEKHVVRRNVPWLTPSLESSVNFTPLHALDGVITPNGLCFERHH
ncbi:MAG: twin-arginine translocation signal domain-containing protein, partial [Hyphomicrobiales bacterium]|nr:twin-arginine translocation signal domain-containing protein [Hyphomicrobiales bacterium]